MDNIFKRDFTFKSSDHWGRKEMLDVFCKGGYPNAVELDDVTRDQWYDNLLTTIIERDIQDIANISRSRDMIKLLSIIAERSSNLLNLSELSRISAIPYTTLNHYMMLLESLFLLVRQPAWHTSKAKRIIKMPKIYFGDTGLLINQLKIGREPILDKGRLLGFILENFIFLELKKLISCSDSLIELYHYRTQAGVEVDFILENRAGQIVAIELKASETISPDDCKGINFLKQEMGEKMVRGIILYPGSEVIAFGKDCLAIPISTLWQ